MAPWIKIILSLTIPAIVAVTFSFLAKPVMLLMLLLLPLFFLIYQSSDNNLLRRLKLFYGEELYLQQLPTFNKRMKDMARFAIYFAILFTTIALAQPKWGFHWEEITREGTDLIIALDISESMLADDLNPNRLERAKRKISDLLKILEGDRVGLTIFSGQAFTLCPLTLDYGALAMFLNDVDTDFLPVKGTNISEAIEVSLDSFKDVARKNKAIILITDGEQNEGEVLKAAESARKKGVKIFCIGIGNPAEQGGVPIPLKGGGVKKSADGNIIMTKINETLLAQIAQKTSGRYILTESGDIDLIKIYGQIKKTMERKQLKSSRKKIYEHRFQWFLFAAIFLLMVTFQINYGKTDNRSETTTLSLSNQKIESGLNA